MAAAAVRDEQLNKLLQCSICIKIFTDPRTLGCLHTFCFKCIAECFARVVDEDEDAVPTCPECCQETDLPKNGLVGLKKNFFMASLMSVVLGSRSIPPTLTDGAQLLFTLGDPPTDSDCYPREVRGVAMLDNYICVIYDKYNKVQVFDSADRFRKTKEIQFSETSSPFAMVGCSVTSQLFVSEWANENIFRLNVNTGVCDVFIKLDYNTNAWLSLVENRLLWSALSSHSLLTYDIHSAQRMTSIPYTDILSKFGVEHAIESNRDSFFVCNHHVIGNTVFEIDSEGGVIRVFDNEEHLHCIYVALDSVGRLLVVDYTNHCIVLLDEDLKFLKVLLSQECFDFAWPLTVTYDQKNNRLAVGLDNGHVKLFTYYCHVYY